MLPFLSDVVLFFMASRNHASVQESLPSKDGKK